MALSNANRRSRDYLAGVTLSVSRIGKLEEGCLVANLETYRTGKAFHQGC